jgi:ACS family hexuronate transporter-like MFS transporter
MGYSAINANMLTLPSDVFPPNAVSSVFGMASMGAGFGGMIFMWATGKVVDAFSYQPIFFAAGIMPLICALLLWTWVPPIQSMRPDEWGA